MLPDQYRHFAKILSSKERGRKTKWDWYDIYLWLIYIASRTEESQTDWRKRKKERKWRQKEIETIMKMLAIIYVEWGTCMPFLQSKKWSLFGSWCSYLPLSRGIIDRCLLLFDLRLLTTGNNLVLRMKFEVVVNGHNWQFSAAEIPLLYALSVMSTTEVTFFSISEEAILKTCQHK